VDGDRNGGFSRADFAQLYAPPLMDPVYGYQAVNVEAQLRTPTSLLRWLHRFIALRKEHPVFGFGTYEPIVTSNPRIFAHIRRFEDDVDPLRPQRRPLGPGRRARPLRYEGRYPVEMFGRSRSRGSGAALPADARAARLLLVPARRRGPRHGGSARCLTTCKPRRASCGASSTSRRSRNGSSASAGTPRSRGA
jgi:hypothetical protein